MYKYFRDRVDAGQKLARFLEHLDYKNAVVYALPRGGVIIGAEIARKLGIPLDLIITKKIRNPYNPEHALGAVAEDGHSVLSDEILTVDPIWIAEETEKAIAEIKRRKAIYLKGREPISCLDKIAILADDGIATGLTMKVAIKELKLHFHPKRIIVVVPVTPKDILEELRTKGVEVISILTLKELGSVGSYYLKFPQVKDIEVIKHLDFFAPQLSFQC